MKIDKEKIESTNTAYAPALHPARIFRNEKAPSKKLTGLSVHKNTIIIVLQDYYPTDAGLLSFTSLTFIPSSNSL